MQTTIGNLDPATGTVEVHFEHDDIEHVRQVRAVLDEAGDFDAAATQALVDQLALGVAEKMRIGLITAQPWAPPPVPELPEPSPLPGELDDGA